LITAQNKYVFCFADAQTKSQKKRELNLFSSLQAVNPREDEARRGGPRPLLAYPNL